MKRWPQFILLLTTAAFGHAEEFVPGKRQPQWPLKSSRVLLNDKQIAKAHRLCERDASAKAVREKILKDCEYWLAKSDRELHDLLPDYRVPRDFDVSADGCPVHGTAVYRHGTYPWLCDREHPFTLTCPLGGEKYPSNDFEAYYRTGMTDTNLLMGPYADAGRGWVAPDGKKFWLVAYACHWNWMHTWLPAVNTLSQAYVLTGDPRYARKAIVMLDRIAEIYPGMDYAKQSRYGELMKGTYHGKISNLIWETVVLKDLAIAYDRIFPALIGESATSLPWRSAEQIRANIEANLLEEGLDGIESEKIAGNYGLHQNAQIYTALVRQNGPTKELLRGIFEQTGKTLRHEGLNYALYNLIYKDGMPYETSPNYGSGWVHCFVNMADPLKLAGYDIYTLPRMKGVFDGFLDLICDGQFTPAIGDSGSIHAGWITPGFDAYEAAYREYREPRFAWALCHWTKREADQITSFDDLFKEPIITAARRDAAKYQHQPRSRLLDGFGTAILNNRRDSLAVSLFYGEYNVHAHRDRLNIELFGYGRRLSPDLGYPDQTDAFHPGRFSWTDNTISHNCLVVDQTHQRGTGPGKVLRLHDSPTVHVVDVDAAATYAQTDVYRRTLVLVHTSEEHSYLVDVVRVRGGTNHCLSLHGTEGEFTWSGSVLSPPVTEGTLAGRDISLGVLYDDPVYSQPGYRGPYKDYRGSGYSHFFNWQRTKPEGITVGQWQFIDEPAAGLRVHVMPCAGQEVVVADAYVSPHKKIPTVLKYVLVQRGLSPKGNTFITVWEPHSAKPIIDKVEIIGADSLANCDADATLSVKRGEIVDEISVATQAGRNRSIGSKLESDAAVTVVSRANGVRTRTFAAGGTKLVANGADAARIAPSLSGTVQAVNYERRLVTIKSRSPISDVAALVGHNVRLFNDEHSCTYPVSAARMKDGLVILELGGPEPITGRLKVTAFDITAKTISTSSFRPCPVAVSGMHLASKDFRHTAKIVSLKDKVIQLADSREMRSVTQSLKTGDDVWIVDFGVGDDAEVEAFTHEANAASLLAASTQPTLHPKAQALPFAHQGPFVTTADGGALCLDEQNALHSRDEGRTWTSTPIFRDPTKFEISDERALLRTRDGVVIAAWMNMAEQKSPPGWNWGGSNVDFREFVLPIYVCRSLDDGKTWDEPVKLNEPWCGCIHSMIETRSGRIVLVGQEVIPAWRHATVMFVSDDKGKTWRRSNVLDIGQGRHDHAGAIEGTVVERKDGSLYQLLRTETGWLYESVSLDGGLKWEGLKQSPIKSVTCCPQMGRLSDGRVALLWNHPPRHKPDDKWSREELSIAFSDDDCRTWSKPVVIAARHDLAGRARVSYPYLYERKPGELWITTMGGQIRMKISLADIPHGEVPIFKSATAIPPTPADIIMFGDSTTAKRPGAVDKVYAQRVQETLKGLGSNLLVQNAGIGGNSTRDAKKRFDADVLRHKPRVIVMQFGLNDSSVEVWRKPPATEPRVPLAEFEANLRTMIEQARQQGAKVILMTTNPQRWTSKLKELYGRAPYHPDDPDGFDAPVLAPYNEAVRKLAKELEVPLVDIHDAYPTFAAKHNLTVDQLLLDGMHPTDQGHQLVTKLLVPVIRDQVK